MTTVFSGLKVLDLSWGMPGPMVGMILGDAGADVVKVEPPGGDRFRDVLALGYKTWQRGKRSVALNLRDAADLAVFRALAAEADVLIESFAPGKAAALGIDQATLAAINPRLVYLSLTAYGRGRPDSDRPGYDILVGARTGLLFEHRGWDETALVHQNGTEDVLADLEVDYSILQGPPRRGPVLTASPAASIGAFYCALTAVHAALIARERTGRGQWVETSLLQGAITAAAGVWQKADRSDAPNFNMWILGAKGPKGQFKTSDGRWIHNWVPNPRFLMNASEGDTINASPDLSVQNDPDRFGTGVEETFVITFYQPQLAERVAKFPAADWVAAAALADVTLQDCRPVEEAYADPLLLADGCIREIDDPELGPIRQVGTMVNLSATPWRPGGPAPSPGQHDAEVRAAAARVRGPAAVPAATGDHLPPLHGIKVLDLGLAIAGPFGTQQLSDLGAEVIKINTLWDSYWHSTHIAFSANRGKRSLCMDLKRPEAMDILHRLVAGADIVQHNMRYEAAVRLGVDYDSLKKINPALIYCHTRGHDRGPRETMPGNDQTGACIAGVQYEDGGVANGGRPIWSLTSFGDTGNGYLSAVGIMQALHHRARTGEGQFVDTSIVNAQLLNISYTLGRPDGAGFDRPRLDAMATHLTALYGLYETGDGWIALAVTDDGAWAALKRALALPDDGRFADAPARRRNDAGLYEVLKAAFATGTAADWFARLDAAGVPVEVADPDGGRKILADEDLKRRHWIAGYPHELVGRFEQAGLGFDFSDTPGVIQGPPLIVGDSTRAILTELGYDAAEIAALRDARVIATWEPGEPQIMAVKTRRKKTVEPAAVAAE